MQDTLLIICVILVVLLLLVCIFFGAGTLFEVATDQGFIGFAAYIGLWSCVAPLMFFISFSIGFGIMVDFIRDSRR